MLQSENVHALDHDRREPEVNGATGDRSEEREKPDAVVRCAACGHVLTRPSDRLVVNGKPDHVFTNPHGYVFHVLCFAEAPGVGAIGTPSSEWAWFAGYEWRMATCRGCLAHVGWSFDKGEHRFWGLIAGRLDGAAP